MADVNLKTNDKKIPLNDFMQELLTNIILGYLKTAKRMPDEIKTINIEIQL
ncbi:MAG: hypothetical protein ACFFDO_03045 [Candidatus Thorarchaeota archaeon]